MVKKEGTTEEAPRRSTRLHSAPIAKPSPSKLNKKTVKKAAQPKKQETPEEEDKVTANSFFGLSAVDNKNNTVDFSDYKGKVILVVNVASKCGHTKAHYSQLEPLYQKYKDQGFEIFAFPCGQFGSQEFKTNDQICEFVKQYNVSFKLFDKTYVKGPNANPVYKYLKSVIPGDIKWNFGKYLIDKNGIPHQYYESKIKPNTMEDDIEKLLEQK